MGPASLVLVLALTAEPTTVFDGVDRARLELIRDVEREEAVRASVWRWGWGGAYAAITVAQAVAIPFLKDPGDRVDFIVGAVSSGLGTLFTVLLPLSVISHAPKVQALPSSPEGLVEAERWLEEDSADEDFALSWVMHVGNVAYSAVTGLVLGLGWQRWVSAAINTAVGIAIGEVMILTTPRSLRGCLRGVTAAPLVGPGLGGLSVSATW